MVGLVAGAGVEPSALHLGRHQTELLALGVDAQQMRRHRGQQAQGHRLVVDEDPVAPRAADHPPHHELVLARPQPGVGQQPPGFVRHLIEGARDGELFGLGADQVAGGTRAGEQTERIDQDRLAGAGLAAEHVETRLELDRDVGGDGEVLDVEVA